MGTSARTRKGDCRVYGLSAHSGSKNKFPIEAKHIEFLNGRGDESTTQSRMALKLEFGLVRNQATSVVRQWIDLCELKQARFK